MNSGNMAGWVLPCFLIIYAVSAWKMVILDCDETFNYLEPLHYLLFGTGFQTWEYAPKFALRPYSFLLLFSLPFRALMKLFGLQLTDRIVVFKMVRMAMGLASAWSQAHFIEAVSMHVGGQIANLTAIIMMTSTGLFVASTAFLPNTFSMILLCLIWSYWLRGHDNKVLLLTALNFVLAWPYAVICAIIPCLFSVKKAYMGHKGQLIETAQISTTVKFQLLIRRLFAAGLFGFIYILLPSLLVEHHYYGRWTFPSLNALLYNVINKDGGGPELFGVEPWHYYPLNLLLNFNGNFLLMLVSPLVALLSSKQCRLLILNLWSPLVIFGKQPHKEERFLFILYPLICFSSAITLSSLFKTRNIFIRFGALLCIIASASISLSRSYALVKFYEAPQYILETSYFEEKSTVCMAGNWSRYPGSFYLPPSNRIGFVKIGDLMGQLPIYFESTQTGHSQFNSLNQEVPAQFTDKFNCDYFFGSPDEYSGIFDDQESSIVSSGAIADINKTPKPFKWLWIPLLSRKHTEWQELNLYKFK